MCPLHALSLSRRRFTMLALLLAVPLLTLLMTHGTPLRSADEPKPVRKLELHKGDHICIRRPDAT